MRTIQRNDMSRADAGITLHYYGEDGGVVARYRLLHYEGELESIEVVVGPDRDYGNWIGPDDLATVTLARRYGKWEASISWSGWGRQADPDRVSKIADSFAIAHSWYEGLKMQADTANRGHGRLDV